ncbi:efflux RND transporter periplasmic adaptor subunit [Ningiella sp. W23]|uniref:efflux RND transporter periplasmic adaptor subunit n=1 Tax=Ningiella sp. W23 TaxID=3023715 RepID=UPI0037567FBE
MKKLFVFLCVVVGVGILIGIKKSNSASALEVNAAEVSVQEIESSILASGNVIYYKEVSIRSEVTGRVLDVFVEEGDEVKKGDILAKLDDTSFKARVERMVSDINLQNIELRKREEEFERAKQQLERQKKLQSKGLSSVDAIDELETSLTIAKLEIESTQASIVGKQALLDEARQELAKTVFTSPIDGLVVDVGVKVGETVVAGTTNIIGSELMLVSDPSSMKVNLRVDEADIANVRLGQRVNVYAAADQDKKILGTVSKLGVRASSANANANSGLVVMIKVDLEGDTSHLRSGMSCRAEIVKQQIGTAKVVPISALNLASNDVPYIWVIEEGKASRQEVELGLATDTEQQILAGLETGQEVIIGPSRTTALLKEGMAVQAMQVESQG